MKVPAHLDAENGTSAGQREQPRERHRDNKQHAHHRERKLDFAAAIEQHPGRDRKPGDQSCGSPVDAAVELIVH
jgi:hypothetical protein